MIELFFVACMVAQPDACEENGIILSHNSAYHCLMESSLHLSRWSADHPGWTIQEFACRNPADAPQDA